MLPNTPMGGTPWADPSICVWYQSLDCACACFESAMRCQHVWIFGLSTSGYMFAEWRIIGKGTSYYATHTIRTHYNMSMNFNNPNWVRAFTPFLFSCDCLLVFIPFPSSSGSMLSVVFENHRCGCVCAGHLTWRHHGGLPLPSHHVLCATCM